MRGLVFMLAWAVNNIVVAALFVASWGKLEWWALPLWIATDLVVATFAMRGTGRAT